MISAAEIVDSLGSLLIERRVSERARFRDAVIDSRRAGRGDLFVALTSGHRDGHDFARAAIERGARGLLVSRELEDVPTEVAVFRVPDTLAALQRLAAGRRDRRPAKVIGITGSVGKTTTKEITAAVLGGRAPVLKNEANYNTEIGLPLTLLKLSFRHRRAVLEMAMRAPGEIRTLCEIARPEVGVITNIGPTHLEQLGSLEAIAAAKGELLESLPPHGFAVLNADDPLVMAMAGRTRARPVTFGLSPDAEVRAVDVAGRGLEGVDFTLRWHGDGARVQSSLPGRRIVPDALAASAVALTDGLPLRDVAAALASARAAGRMIAKRGRGGSTILDDSYNASPASMAAALDLLAEIPGRRIAVLGDMRELGAAERDSHLDVGRRAADVAQVIHTVGDLGALIAAGAQDAGHAATHHWPSKEEAAGAILEDLTSGDAVLVKASRAMEFESIVEALEE